MTVMTRYKQLKPTIGRWSSTEPNLRPPTQVVNIRHERYDVYIGRPSIFGNPFKMEREEQRDAVIEAYRRLFNLRMAEDPKFKQKVEALRGKRLGCYCSPKSCHGDVIVKYLETSR